MTIRIRLFAWALLIASVALLVTPNAQSNPKAAKKKAKTTTAEASPAPEATPSLEPKALDILKAARRRPADHRRSVGAGLSLRRNLFPVCRLDRGGSLQGDVRRHEARLLYRPVQSDRRNDD